MEFKKIAVRFAALFFLAAVLACLPVQSADAKAKLNKSKVTLSVGNTVQLKVTGTSKSVKWYAAPKSVCSVTQKGLVTAKKAGTAYVKAKAGGTVLKCTVKVKAGTVQATQLKLSAGTKILAPGGSTTLSVEYVPGNAKKEALVWSTSSSYRATVENGVVTAVNTGSVTITAKLQSNENVSASYTFEVKNISAETSVVSADGGDLLLNVNGTKAQMKFSMSDTVPDVSVNVCDSIGNVIRTYDVGDVGADTDNTVTWDLLDADGNKVSAGTYCFEINAVGGTIRTDYVTVYGKSEFAGGNGSAAMPYQVSNVEQLKAVGSHNGVNFIQTADIDFNLTELVPLFTADVPFTGTYDGGNYTISNISTMRNSADYVGIFCSVGKGGTVQNVKVAYSSFNGNSYVGAVAGYNNGIIKNCTSSSNNILAANNYAGGVVGENGGTVTGCSSSSDSIIAQERYAGGSVGTNSGNIIDCQVNNTAIKDTGWFGGAGGIAGYNGGSVNNCRASETTVTGFHMGGIIGKNEGNNTNNTYTGTLDQVGW